MDSKITTSNELLAAIHLQRFDRLKTCRLFSDISDNDLEKICKLVNEQYIEAGETFIGKNSSQDCFFIIIKGKAKVYRIGDHDEEITLAVVGPGECVGEMGFFSDDIRTASVRSIVDSQVIQITYENLKKAFEHTPDLAKNFTDVVTRRITKIKHPVSKNYSAKPACREFVREPSQLIGYVGDSDI